MQPSKANSPPTSARVQAPQESGVFRRVAVMAGILGLIGFLVFRQFGGPGGPTEGAPAPVFSTETLSGDVFDLAEDGLGKVVVLDFWATWCTPCVKSLPALQKVHEQYLGNDDVIVASVNTDQGRSWQRRVELFLKHNRFDFLVLFDQAFKIQNAYGVASIPTMVVIDRLGVVRNVKVGIHTTNTDLIAEGISEMIEEAM